MSQKTTDTFIPITNLANKIFIVEEYQRGYKWGQLEIEQLLNDLDKHGTDKGPYCLQPIIIKPITDEKYEVIDGQQRLTSIYLLMHYFEGQTETIKYNIEYKTREHSKNFLQDRNSLLACLQSESWQSFIAENTNYNNVDIFHFYQVYNSINNWFTSKSKDKVSFLKKIKKILYIIWYDITKGNLPDAITVSAENVFINLNANKVDLSGSELIKALFILDYSGSLTKEQKKHKSIEMALEWDMIENCLQNNTFWYFICNNEKYNQSATRIDFLFDLICKAVSNKDKLAAYRQYEQLIIDEDSKEKEWKKVKTLFYKLDEWYKHQAMYHYIGFLTATKLASIDTIIENSNKKTKQQFEDYLTSAITKEFKKEENGNPVYILDALDYINTKTECNRLLLLLNLNKYLKNRSNNKFPFNLYHEMNWSLEHINPQNPKEFTDKSMLQNWIKSIETFNTNDQYKNTENANIFSNLLEELKFLVNKTPDFEQLKKDERFIEKTNDITERINIHNIANLALLDRNTNSALGNRPYLEKREIVLRFDRNGVDDNGKEIFIPMCTRDLFTKTYSYLKNENVGTYFTAKDMTDYQQFIIEELKIFLPVQKKEDEPV